MSAEKQHQEYLEHGWCTFPFDQALADWVESSLHTARQSVREKSNQKWLRHNGTWFAGVNALDNDFTGAVSGGLPLAGAAMEFVTKRLGFDAVRLDCAQVSVCYPGYPQPSADEPEPAFGYRLRRDAAHIDGLLREGPKRKRYIREHHGFILGIPMVRFSRDAAPFVAWRGSHHLAKQAFSSVLNDHAENIWPTIDVTERYKALRREIFERCERVEIALQPGEAFLVHRLALHGTGRWQPAATAGQDGRMICFFRPDNVTPSEWLNLP